jgi:hypothetical protein
VCCSTDSQNYLAREGGSVAPTCYCLRVPRGRARPSPTASQAREELIGLLEVAYASAEGAQAALRRALQLAMRHELPTSVAELLTFVRIGLLPVLSADLGPRLTMSLLEDFIKRHEIRSGVRERSVQVILVDTDRLGRSVLARALLRERWQVTVVDSLEELGELARSGEAVDVAILDGRHPAKLLILEMMVDHFPSAALVVRSAAEGATCKLLQALGVASFEMLPVDAPSEAIVEAARRMARSARPPG